MFTVILVPTCKSGKLDLIPVIESKEKYIHNHSLKIKHTGVSLISHDLESYYIHLVCGRFIEH